MIEFIRKGRKDGFSARSIILFAMLASMVLHILIGLSTVLMNHLRDGLERMTQRSTVLTEHFTTLRASPAALQDSALLYVLTGDTAFLDDYVESYKTTQSSIEALGVLLTEDELTQVQRSVADGRSRLAERTERECRAILLAASARSMDLSEWELFQSYSLSETERGMSALVQQTAAEALLNELTYRSGQAVLESDVHRAQLRIEMMNNIATSARSRLVTHLRRIVGIFSAIVVIVLAGMCVMLFRLMVMPLEECIQKVQEGDRLPVWKGMLELRRLAMTYNQVVSNRNVLEGNLRSLSLTDALTNLPNRLAFENYMNRLRVERPEVALTVFSLDVNGLKQINDTLGHVYGDELLRKSADCILEVFSDKSGKNCFRFGGDEFAAFWVDTPYSEIEPTLERFKAAQKVRGVSIAVGFAYTNKLSSTTVDVLYEQADEEMYRRKAAHKQAELEKQDKPE